jgi:hypothetical protein
MVIIALASIFQLNLQPIRGGFRGGYTLLGSSIAKLHFENQPIRHTTRKTLMHIVKWVEARVSLALVATSTLTIVTTVIQLLFTI